MITYVNLSGGALVAPRSLLRATFSRTVAGTVTLSSARDCYDEVVNAAPASGIGYVASVFNSAPGDTALTVDIRRDTDGPPLGAASIASTLDSFPHGYELVRLELVAPAETSSAASEARQQATTTEQAKPGVLDTVLSSAQSVGKWFLWVLALAAFVLILWLLR